MTNESHRRHEDAGPTTMNACATATPRPLRSRTEATLVALEPTVELCLTIFAWGSLLLQVFVNVKPSGPSRYGIRTEDRAEKDPDMLKKPTIDCSTRR